MTFYKTINMYSVVNKAILSDNFIWIFFSLFLAKIVLNMHEIMATGHLATNIQFISKLCFK